MEQSDIHQSNGSDSVPVQSPAPEQHVAKPKPQRRTLLSRKLHTHTLDIITCKFVVVDFRTIKAEQV